MLITKFNKLIRNKVLWTVFALVVCFSFVFGSLVGRGERSDRKAGSAGVLFGEEISTRDFFQARFYELGMREPSTLSPEANAQLREQTWKRLAVLRQAHQMGLTVTAAEIADVIQRDPTFQVNGVFSKQRYRGIIEQQLRVGVGMFEEYVRQDILMRKVMQVIQSMVWIAPEEIARRLDSLTDEFQLEYAVVTPTAVADEVTVSMDDARTFYEANTEQFMEPEKMNVRYVAFPISNRLNAVTISEDEVRAYYESHPEEFTTASTNAEEQLVPFDAVRGGITDQLARRQAAFRTRDAAVDLVMALTPGRYSKGLALEAAALQSGLPVATTDFFSVESEVPGLDDVDADFVDTAFALDADSEDAYFSDPIVGQDHVYVIAANDRREAHTPPFEEVAERALELAKAQARRDALRDRAEEVLGEARAESSPFAAVLEPYGITVSTSEVFTVYEGSEDLEFADELFSEIMNLREGEYARPIPVPDGILLARVSKRAPGDIASAQLLRTQLQMTLSRYRAAMIYSDWADALLAQAEFKDYAPVVVGNDEEG